MKIIVFGATGSVGNQLVKQALEQGNEVTAFTRNPGKLSHINDPRLKIIRGDILDLADVEKAMQHQDGVLCAIGDGSKGTVRAEGTKNIIMAMKKAGVNRLICETTLGLGESHAIPRMTLRDGVVVEIR